MSSWSRGRPTTTGNGRRWSKRTRAAVLAGALGAGLLLGAVLTGAALRDARSRPGGGEVSRVSPFARFIREQQAAAADREPARVSPAALTWRRGRRLGGTQP